MVRTVWSPVQDSNALIDSWIDAFGMTENDKGEWGFANNLIQERDESDALYYALRRDWNKFVTEYNAVVAPRLRNFGRPLAASETQRQDVLDRHKAGESLRSIAEETGLPRGAEGAVFHVA